MPFDLTNSPLENSIYCKLNGDITLGSTMAASIPSYHLYYTHNTLV